MSYPEREQARPKVNARLYNPYLGRFVSPDPLLNSEGSAWDYNPYVYVNNNPYKYIDRNGECWWLVAAAIFGGGANVMANFDNINSTGDFIKIFGVGALAGAGAACIGAAATPLIVSAMGSAGLGALSGAAVFGLGAASNYLLQGGLNSAILGIPFQFSWIDLGFQVGSAAILGGIVGYNSAKLNGLNPWSGKSTVMATRHRPLMTNPDEIAAMAEADVANSVPINYENSATQFTAYQKGEMGKLQRINEIIEDGGTILGTEVTIEVNGIKIRPDIVYRNKDGLLIFSEVKNGPYARFTTNQGKAIPIMQSEHPFILPKGGNAAKIPEFKNVMINNAPYKGNYGVEVIHYNPAILH